MTFGEGNGGISSENDKEVTVVGRSGKEDDGDSGWKNSSDGARKIAER